MRWGVLALCTGIGALLGKLFDLRKKKRVILLQEIVSHCNFLRDGIAFHRKSLAQILDEIQCMSKTQWRDIVRAFYNEITSSEPTEAKRFCRSAGLKEDEIRSLTSFFLMLGKSDVSHQESLINSFKNTFEGYYEQARMDYEKTSKTYLKLGLLGGLAIGIMLA